MAVYGSNYIYGDSYYKDLGELPDQSHIPVDSDYYLVSFTMAVLPEQGVAFSENTGDDWCFTEPGFTGLQIEDENGIKRQLSFHDRKGYVTDIATKDGPEGSDQEQVWQDGVDINDANGTDVEPWVRYPSDEGTYEHFWILLSIAHFFLRAAADKYRGATGYGTDGLPDGLEIDLGVFVDGERSTASRLVTNIPVTGDVHTEEHVEGYRIAHEVSANMGAHCLVGRKCDYVVNDRPVGSGVMTEDDYCEELSRAGMWFSRGWPYTDRATGLELSSAIQALITLTTGPDSRSNSAWEFDEAITLPSVTIPGGSLMFFGQNITSMTIGGVSAPYSEYATQIGSWKLYYLIANPAGGPLIESGAIVVTPNGTGKLFDLRVFLATVVSVAAIGYYFNNINDHDGDVVLP